MLALAGAGGTDDPNEPATATISVISMNPSSLKSGGNGDRGSPKPGPRSSSGVEEDLHEQAKRDIEPLELPEPDEEVLARVRSLVRPAGAAR